MTVYAIGDLQGCLDPLKLLLDEVQFQPGRDQLWLVGDLVNRGPQSLETLRYVHGLGDSAVAVLGNHDLHLIALHAGLVRNKIDSGLNAVMHAPDADELIDWLRRRPLIHHDASLGYAMVHAGLPAEWDIATARALAAEAEAMLRADDYRDFFRHMYGDQPNRWSADLQGADRLRFIINACTRMRFCAADGSLDFSHKGPPGTQPAGLMPWFEMPGRRNASTRLICGHWSALGMTESPTLLTLDGGCVWGGRMVCATLRTGGWTIVSRPCPQYAVSKHGHD